VGSNPGESVCGLVSHGGMRSSNARDLEQATGLIALWIATLINKATIIPAMGVEDENDLGSIILPQEGGNCGETVCRSFPSMENIHPILVPLEGHIHTQDLLPH